MPAPPENFKVSDDTSTRQQTGHLRGADLFAGDGMHRYQEMTAANQSASSVLPQMSIEGANGPEFKEGRKPSDDDLRPTQNVYLQLQLARREAERRERERNNQ